MNILYFCSTVWLQDYKGLRYELNKLEYNLIAYVPKKHSSLKSMIQDTEQTALSKQCEAIIVRYHNQSGANYSLALRIAEQIEPSLLVLTRRCRLKTKTPALNVHHIKSFTAHAIGEQLEVLKNINPVEERITDACCKYFSRTLGISI